MDFSFVGSADSGSFHGLSVLLFSLCSALFAELVAWLLVYRTSEFKKIKASVDDINSRLAKNRRWSLKVKKQKAQGKRVKHLDALLQIKAGEMKRASYKSNALVFVSLALAYALLSQFYHGVAVCRLPFLPFPLIRPITHLGLPGQDFTECSMTFLYSLCSLSVTQSVQKLFGFSTSITPPSSSSSSPTSSISASTVQYNTPAYK